MQRYEDSVSLAKTLVGIGTQTGKTTVALITQMDQPLGNRIGNWCEVVESMECLRGKRVDDLMEVTFALGALMLMAAGKAVSVPEGIRMCEEALWSGRAYEKFVALVHAQGGDITVLERPSNVPPPAHTNEAKADRKGYVAAFSTREIGVLAAEMGAGRMKVDDRLDLSAGMTLRKKLGDAVERGETLAEVYGSDRAKVERAAGKLPSLLTIADSPGDIPPRIRAMVDGSGEHAWNPGS